MSFPAGLLLQLQKLLSQSWLPYLFALITVGLLPVKRRLAYFLACLALALLWGEVAYAAWAYRPPASPVWAGLAAVEGLLFLIAAFSGKVKLEVRTGGWAVAGALMIVYSLLVFPLLGRLEMGVSPDPGAGCPEVPAGGALQRAAPRAGKGGAESS